MVSVFTPDLLTSTVEAAAPPTPLVVLCLSADWGALEEQTLWLAVALHQAGRPLLLAAAPGSALHLRARAQRLPCLALPAGIRGASQLARQLRQHQAAVLLTTRPADLGLARLLKLWRGRALRLVHRQLEPLAPAGRLAQWWAGRQLRAVDACVAAFPQLARLTQQHTPIDPRRLWVVPPVFVPAPAFEKPGSRSEARHLLDLPRPAALLGVVACGAHGPAFAIEALYRLREELGGAAELVIIGCPATPPEAAYWARLRQLAQQLHIGHCVHLRPLHNSAQPTLFYQALDVLLLPGRAGTTGPALLEAMTSGCPLVSVATADAPDLLEEGVTARLFPLNDLASCAEALAAALAAPEAGRRMARRAAALVAQRCGLQQQGQQLESVIQYVCRHETLV